MTEPRATRDTRADANLLHWLLKSYERELHQTGEIVLRGEDANALLDILKAHGTRSEIAENEVAKALDHADEVARSAEQARSDEPMFLREFNENMAKRNAARLTKRAFYERVVEELNLDTTDPFTNVLANTFALVDQRDALKEEIAQLQHDLGRAMANHNADINGTLSEEQAKCMKCATPLSCDRAGRCLEAPAGMSARERIDRIRRDQAGEPITPKQAAEAINRVALDLMVDRFLSWPLPASVCSDLCVTSRGAPHRIGTNLLTADEARQMLQHVLSAPVSATSFRSAVELLREALPLTIINDPKAIALERRIVAFLNEAGS